jgi:hypothetical protein
MATRALLVVEALHHLGRDISLADASRVLEELRAEVLRADSLVLRYFCVAFLDWLVLREHGEHVVESLVT